MPGVPDFLLPSLLDWLSTNLHARGRGLNTRFRGEIVRAFEQTARQLIDDSPVPSFRAVEAACRKDADFALDLVAFIVETLDWEVNLHLVKGLESMLENAGSEWRVRVQGRSAKLERRVRNEIRTAKEHVVSVADRAGAHIEAAWGMIYGRNPNPNDAYREAVVAVEAAAVPIVSPKNTKATLGTMIADLKNSPEKFSVVLRPIDSVVSFDVALGMCQMLWKSQPARHGTPAANPHSTVSQKEAEAAVHLAILLVHWFTTDVIVRS